MKIVIRPKYTSFDTKKLPIVLEYLSKTEYKPGSKDNEAPKYTDCITAIRHILREISDFSLPKSYIGDMPRILIDVGCQEVSIKSASIGDLVFFERMSFTHKKYMIAHIGIMISQTEFFHSSLHFSGGMISSLEDIEYNSLVLDESYLLIAHDPRTYV